MGFDHNLPTIDTQLSESPLEECDASLTNYSDFEFVFVYIPDPPKVEVEQEHLIEAVNHAELESILVSVDEETDETVLFYVTDSSSTAYRGNIGDGVHTLVDVLLCEDWFVLLSDTSFLPDSVAQYISEMTVLPEGYADEGELFSQTYAKNRLKHRIYDIKQTDTDLFTPDSEVKS